MNSAFLCVAIGLMLCSAIITAGHAFVHTSAADATNPPRNEQPARLPGTGGVPSSEQETVTAFVTRTEPDETVGLSLLIGDFVAGADAAAQVRVEPPQPDHPRHREFSAWQTTTDRELFATPGRAQRWNAQAVL